MFEIYADTELLYNSAYPDRVLTKGELELEVNRSGSFTFQLYPDHPMYNTLTELKTTITAYRDGDLMYRGRIIRRPDGFNLDRTFICEGELSFLIDSKVRPYSFSGSPTTLFTQLITAHNAQVADDRKFTVGTVTVTDPNDYITRANSEYPTTYDELMDKLVNPLGGYIVFTAGENGDRVINWLSAYPTRDVQSIDFGENLLDYTNTRSAEAVATALIPLGAKLDAAEDGTEPRLTIESVNDGVDYIYDAAAVARYGWIYETHIWDDVTVASNLLIKGLTYLSELTMPTESIELSALDMSALDSDINAFQIGDVIPVKSEPHNLDASYLLRKQTINILRPESNKITLGYTGQTLTFATLSNSRMAPQVTSLSESQKKDSASITSLQTSVSGISGDIDDINTNMGTLSDNVTLAINTMSDDLTALETKVDSMYMYRDAISADDVTINANGGWSLNGQDISVDGYAAEAVTSFGVFPATNGGVNSNWCIVTRAFVYTNNTINAYVWNQNASAAAKVKIIIRVKYRKL